MQQADIEGLGRAEGAAAVVPSYQSRTAARRRRWRALGPPLLLALAPFAYYWRATLGRIVLMESDGFAFHLPFRLLAARYAKQGYWPLWNPAVLSGFPFLAAMQPALCYPTTWLFACLPPVAAMNLQVLISYSVAALGMYAYARALGCARLAASFAAVTFAFNGFMLQRAIGHLGLLLALVWLPLVLWSLERLRQSLRARFAIIGAGAVSLAIFGGHPQIPAYILFLSAGYILFFTWAGPPVGRIRFAAWGAATLAAGVLLSAVQLVPTQELGTLTTRGIPTYETFVSYSLPLRQLPMLLSPFFLDGRAGGGLWGVGTMFIALTGYVGIAAIVLALAVSMRGWRDLHVRFWMVAAVVALLLALGGSIPLARLTFHVPLYNAFRAHARTLVIFDCALAVLSGLALQRVPLRALVPAGTLVAAGTVAIAVVTATIGRAIWGPLASAELTGEALRGLLAASFSFANLGLVVPVLLSAMVLAIAGAAPRAPRVAAIALLAVQLGDFAFFGARIAPPFPPAAAVPGEAFDVSAMRAVVPPPFDFRTVSPAPMAQRGDWQTQTVNGYESMPLARYGALAGGLDFPGGISVAALRRSPGFLDLLNAKYLVFGLLPPETLDPVIDGIGFAPLLLDETLTTGAALEYVVPSPGAVTHIGAVTALANSVTVAEGTPVARLTVWNADGEVEQVMLRAGADTAEWAWERPDVAPVVRHHRAKVADAWSTGGWSAHHYFARLALARRLTVTRMRLEPLLPGIGVMVSRLTLYDAETGRSVPITPEYSLLADSERWTVRYATDQVAVLENHHVLPRAWLVPASARLPPEVILATIRSGSLPDGRRFEPRSLALVEDVPGRDYGPLDPAAAVGVVRYEPNAIELATHSAGSAFLVLSEVFYPGWLAFVDDAPTSIVRTDYALRGIELPAGAHRVRVVYQPTSVKVGLAISLATAGALVTFGVGSRLRRRRRSRGVSAALQASAAPS